MLTELFLIRHGETAWNAAMRFQGQRDSPLTPLGIAQAEATAAYLRSHPLTALYSSDLPRTLQTAQPIARATGLTVIPEAALRERNMGIFEGLTREEIEVLHAQDFARYLAREPEHVIPNGESLQQLHDRGIEVMERLAWSHPGECIAIVSHGALLTTFLRRLHGILLHHPSPFAIHNGSISRVNYDAATGEWTVITLNEILLPSLTS